MLGWHGLINFYEKRQKQEELSKTIRDIIPRLVATYVLFLFFGFHFFDFIISGDGARLAEYLKKLVHIYKSTDPNQYLEVLKNFLPGSTYYDLIKDQPDLPSQIEIWQIIIEKQEKEQAQKVENEVASRRFRVSGGTPAQVLAEVEAEIYGVSKLGVMYEKVLALISDDDVETKQFWKLKLLKFLVKQIAGVRGKAELYEQIMSLASELVLMDDPLPLELLIQFVDANSPGN